MTTLTMEQFQNLPPTEQRIRLAQDVIKHIQTKKLFALEGTYLLFGKDDNPDNHFDIIDNHMTTELKNYIAKEEANCVVCAIGALFITEVMYTNDVSMASMRHPEGINMYLRLQNYFQEEQLSLIEAAFEISAYCAEKHGNEEMLAYKAEDFGALFETDEDRMIAIMQNIIDNRGEFSPP